MEFIFNDGGRAAAGYKGHTGDCVARAIAIASGLPYQEVYDTLASGNKTQRQGKSRSAKNGKKTAAHGINVTRKWFKDQMKAWGFEWIPTMGIGTVCKVHLADGELPMGRLVVSVSRHYTAVIDGVIHDTYSPTRTTHYYENNQLVRSSERCVYGYWRMA